MNYRIANKSDCSVLTQLRMQMSKERDADFCEETLYENTFDFFTRTLEAGSHIAFLCEDHGTVIATAGLSLFEMPPTTKLPNGKVAKLMNMYVIPTYRSQGIAKHMLTFVLNYAREHSYHKIMLNSSPMGEPLYQDFGFQLIPNEYEFYIKQENVKTLFQGSKHPVSR